MKKFKQLFQEAERLTPPPGLWRQIEARVEMRPIADVSGGKMVFWEAPAMRLAATVVLAVGLLGLGVFFQKHPGRGLSSSATAANAAPMAAATAAKAAATTSDQDTEIVDPELLGWHAGLGEVDDEADEAEEVL